MARTELKVVGFQHWEGEGAFGLAKKVMATEQIDRNPFYPLMSANGKIALGGTYPAVGITIPDEGEYGITADGEAFGSFRYAEVELDAEVLINSDIYLSDAVAGGLVINPDDATGMQKVGRVFNDPAYPTADGVSNYAVLDIRV